MTSPEPPVTAWGVRKLRPDDDRKAFRSGQVELDRFFWLYAGQNQFRHHIGTTYVAVDETGRIGGFATVTASEISPDALESAGRRLPRYAVPVLRLARLAVAEERRGAGLGRLLLCSVLELARRMADEVGCLGVVVDAKPDAVTFYEKLGFSSLDVLAGEVGDRPRPVTMFIEVDAISKRLSGSRR